MTPLPSVRDRALYADIVGGVTTFFTMAYIVVSKTMKGMENTAAATVLAAEHYHPAAIINQGTAGGHQPDLHVFDIVLGVDAVNLGSFKTGFRARGEGSNVGDWAPLDLLRADGS